MTSTTATSLPVHMRPESCHVCGGSEASHARTDRPGSGALHTFWSNADALAEAREHDRRTVVTYSGGQHSAEAVYVDETRGR
jgi:hypothetical protein